MLKNKKIIELLKIIKSICLKVWTVVTNIAKAVFTWWFNKKATPSTDWIEPPEQEVDLYINEQSHMVSLFCAWKTWLFMVPSLWLAIVSAQLEPVGCWFWMTSVFFFALGFRWLASRDVFDTEYFHIQRYLRHVPPQFNIYDLYLDVLIGIILWLIGRTIVSLYIYKMNACCNELLGEQIYFEPPIGDWFAYNLTPEAMSALMNLYPDPMWFTGLKRIDTHLWYRQVTAYVSCYVLYRITIREFCTSVARYTNRLHRKNRIKYWLYKYDKQYWYCDKLTYEQITGTLKFLYKKYKLQITIWLNVTFWWVYVWVGYWIWLIISSWI